MWWMSNRLERKSRERANLTTCERCKLFYNKNLDTCPHCSGLSDHHVARLVKQRARFRLGLGKAMLLAAIMIIVFLLLVTSE